MPLFWMTTSATRVSPGAREKPVRPSGATRTVIRWRGCGVFFFESEDVDVEDAFAVGGVLEEVDDLFGLLGVFVVLRDEGVAAGPAMGDELAVFGAGVDGAVGQRFADHVAGLAGGDGVFAVEGQRRLLGEAGALPLVVERDGAEPFVVVEGSAGWRPCGRRRRTRRS